MWVPRPRGTAINYFQVKICFKVDSPVATYNLKDLPKDEEIRRKRRKRSGGGFGCEGRGWGVGAGGGGGREREMKGELVV